MRLPLGLTLPQALYVAIGFAPIGALALALFELLPLHIGALVFVLPAMALAVVLGVRQPLWGRVALAGFFAGVVATGAYDVLRLSLVWAGMWGDFIPAIGRMALLDHDAHPFWGYLWRFVGNGGGMGLAFAMLPWRGARAGVLYGSAICLCLYATVLFSPLGSRELFTMSVATASGAMAGHWVYGAVLGFLTASWVRRPLAELARVVPQAAPTRDAERQASEAASN